MTRRRSAAGDEGGDTAGRPPLSKSLTDTQLAATAPCPRGTALGKGGGGGRGLPRPGLRGLPTAPSWCSLSRVRAMSPEVGSAAQPAGEEGGEEGGARPLSGATAATRKMLSPGGSPSPLRGGWGTEVRPAAGRLGPHTLPPVRRLFPGLVGCVVPVAELGGPPPSPSLSSRACTREARLPPDPGAIRGEQRADMEERGEAVAAAAAAIAVGLP